MVANGIPLNEFVFMEIMMDEGEGIPGQDTCQEWGDMGTPGIPPMMTNGYSFDYNCSEYNEETGECIEPLNEPHLYQEFYGGFEGIPRLLIIDREGRFVESVGGGSIHTDPIWNKIQGIITGTWSCDDVWGCIDPNAQNYNPDANVDDGTCIFEPGPGGPDGYFEPCNPGEIRIWGECYNIEQTTELDFGIGDIPIGEIPEEIGELENLEEIYIGGDHLDDGPLIGTIPEDLGDLESLQVLKLLWNNLTGDIPWELANCTELRDLRLSRNHLGCKTINSEGQCLELCNGTNGCIGEIPQDLGDLTNLNYLFLSYNQLTGEIPQQVCDLIQNNGLDINHILDGNNLINTCDIREAGGREKFQQPQKYYVKYNTRLTPQQLNQKKSIYNLERISPTTKRTDILPSAANLVIIRGNNINVREIEQDPNVVYIEGPIEEFQEPPYPPEEHSSRSRDESDDFVDEFDNIINQYGPGNYHPLVSNMELVDFYHPDIRDKVNWDIPFLASPVVLPPHTFMGHCNMDSNGSNWKSGIAHHGSHTAGSIVGHSHGLGASSARLIPIGAGPTAKIGFEFEEFDNDFPNGDPNDYVTQLEYLLEHGARVVSMSFSGGASYTSRQNAINDAYNSGTFFVASAGNNNSELVDTTSQDKYPCMYDNVMCVGAINASFSNYGAQHVDVSAPKNDLSLVPGPGLIEMINDYNDTSQIYGHEIMLFDNCNLWGDYMMGAWGYGWYGFTHICGASVGDGCDGCDSYHSGIAGNDWYENFETASCNPEVPNNDNLRFRLTTNPTISDWGGAYPFNTDYQAEMLSPADIWQVMPAGVAGDWGFINTDWSSTPMVSDEYKEDSFVHPVTGEVIESAYNTHRVSQGTSMSTPLVASVAALLLSHNEDLTSQDLWDIITTTAEQYEDTHHTENFTQYGRVKPYDAFEYMIQNYGNFDLGCTDTSANNYNPDANYDDGSCTYTGDLNQDGVVNVVDIIALVNYILSPGGTTSELVDWDCYTTSSFGFTVRSCRCECTGDDYWQYQGGPPTIHDFCDVSGLSDCNNNQDCYDCCGAFCTSQPYIPPSLTPEQIELADLAGGTTIESWNSTLTCGCLYAPDETGVFTIDEVCPYDELYGYGPSINHHPRCDQFCRDLVETCCDMESYGDCNPCPDCWWYPQPEPGNEYAGDCLSDGSFGCEPTACGLKTDYSSCQTGEFTSTTTVGDGIINVVDIIAIINIILGQGVMSNYDQQQLNRALQQLLDSNMPTQSERQQLQQYISKSNGPSSNLMLDMINQYSSKCSSKKSCYYNLHCPKEYPQCNFKGISITPESKPGCCETIKQPWDY
jgi:subtilisin family serine protease